MVKSQVEISQNFVAFLEYMNIILQTHLHFDMIESPDGSLGLASLVVHTSSSGIILCH